MSIKPQDNIAEISAALLSAITVSYMFQIVIVTAVSAVVGAVVGHLTKIYLIPMMGRLIKYLFR